MTLRCNVIAIDYICNLIVIRDYFHDYSKVFKHNLIVKATTTDCNAHNRELLRQLLGLNPTYVILCMLLFYMCYVCVAVEV